MNKRNVVTHERNGLRREEGRYSYTRKGRGEDKKMIKNQSRNSITTETEVNEKKRENHVW